MGKHLGEGWLGGNGKTSGIFQLCEFTALVVTILEDTRSSTINKVFDKTNLGGLKSTSETWIRILNYVDKEKYTLRTGKTPPKMLTAVFCL